MVNIYIPYKGGSAMYESVDFFQFQKRFATEPRCRAYLLKQRWPDGFICPRCHHNYGYFIEGRASFQCQRCRYQASVTAGTIFHKTKTPLRKWFWMIYFLSQNKTGYSVLALQKLLNIKQYRTAWLMAHKIRKALADRDSQYKLAGIIEMDDAYFGERQVSGKRGRGAEKKTKVIVSVKLDDWGENPLFANMSVVEFLDKEHVAEVVISKIEAGSTVKTDGFRSYNVLTEQALIHQKKIVHSPENASKYLPWVHILISNCKAMLRGTHHGVSTKHLTRYLSEFCYRFNRRFWQKQLFERMITACLTTNTITLAELNA